MIRIKAWDIQYVQGICLSWQRAQTQLSTADATSTQNSSPDVQSVIDMEIKNMQDLED